MVIVYSFISGKIWSLDMGEEFGDFGFENENYVDIYVGF